MARERVWSRLSENYRKRLTRNGISKEQYESGANLKKARGHENTPENKSDYRRKLQKQIFEKKERTFGQRITWNGERAKEVIIRGSSGEKGDPVAPLSISDMEFLLDFDDSEFEQWVESVDFDDEEYRRYRAAAFYH